MTPYLKRIGLGVAAAFAVGLAALTSTPAAAQTPFSAVIGGKTVRYEAKVDETLLKGPSGQPEARLVTATYMSKDAASPSRPVIFAFNGGPGSSSVYLHFGIIGPKRLYNPGDVTKPLMAPFRLVDNAESPLDVADIVMVDPVGTGYSRLLDPARQRHYYSVEGDGEYIARFIAQWLAEHGRSAAPVYVVGESYGGMRSAAIAKYLTLQHKGVDLKGLVLLSESIGVLETVQRRTNIVGRATALTSLAGIAWYHKKADAGGLELEPYLAKIRDYAANEYLPALYMGNDLPPARRQAVAEQLARFTGLSAETWIDNDLMIGKQQYIRLLMADQGKVLGRYDARYSGPAANGDPSMAGLPEGHAWAIKTVLHDVFKYESGETYRISDSPSPARWVYFPADLTVSSEQDFRAVDSPLDLLEAMQRKPDLRVFITGGFFDTTATIGSDEYLLRRTAFPKDRMTLRHYMGGHMFYTVEDSRLAFASDLRRFVTTR